MEFPIYVVVAPIGSRIKVGREYIEFNESSDGLAFVGGKNGDIRGVWFNENVPLTHETVAHEVYHLFFMTLHSLGEEDGLTYDGISAEIYTYPFGKLMRDVLKVLGVSDKIPRLDV